MNQRQPITAGAAVSPLRFEVPAFLNSGDCWITAREQPSYTIVKHGPEEYVPRLAFFGLRGPAQATMEAAEFACWHHLECGAFPPAGSIVPGKSFDKAAEVERTRSCAGQAS